MWRISGGGSRVQEAQVEFMIVSSALICKSQLTASRCFDSRCHKYFESIQSVSNSIKLYIPKLSTKNVAFRVILIMKITCS